MIDFTNRTGIGYARESKGDAKTKAGRTTRSCAEQSALIQSWADAAGLPLSRIASDDVSASDYSDKEREDWQTVVDDLAAGRANVLVCFEVSRMSRDSEVWAPMLAMARRQGVIIVVDGRVYDMTSDDDEFLLKLMFLFAERETRQTSKRVQRAVNANAEGGKPHGQLPYGYIRHYHPETREFIEQVKHPVQAPIVRRIFDDLAAGRGSYAIAEKLNKEGVPAANGGEWRSASIQNLGRSKTYIGIRVHKGVESRAVWPALVDEEVFWAAQRAFSERRRLTPRSPRKEHVLTSLPRCSAPQCARPARALTRAGRRRYACPKGHFVVDAVELEDLVEDVIVAYLSDRRNFVRLDANNDREQAQARADLEQALAERAELEATAAGMRPTLVAAMDAAIQERIDRANEQMATRSLPPPLRRIIGPAAAKTWSTLDVSARRVIIQLTMSITVRPAGKGQIVPIQDRVDLRPTFA